MTEPTDTAPTDDEVLARLLRSRHSCRAFLSDPVPDETVRLLFALAQRTASWCNSQAWQVRLTSGEETARFAKELGEHARTHPQAPDLEPPAAYEGDYLARRRAAGFGLYNAVGVERGDLAGRERQTGENFRFFGAPHVAVVSVPRSLGVYGAVDCGGYVSTLLTAAQSLGLGAIAQAAIAMYADFVHAYLGIPEDRDIVCAVSFGYTDPTHPANAFRTERAPVDTVVAGLPGAAEGRTP
ncbi:nitroreductase [Streptomyces sp. NPDC085927]|uniref:nitroreductase n=1 Tax=Streptomyces sp. NPDC085927 TaxID=3365738 RepID=UPI0037CFAB9E